MLVLCCIFWVGCLLYVCYLFCCILMYLECWSLFWILLVLYRCLVLFLVCLWFWIAVFGVGIRRIFRVLGTLGGFGWYFCCWCVVLELLFGFCVGFAYLVFDLIYVVLFILLFMVLGADLFVLVFGLFGWLCFWVFICCLCCLFWVG